MTDPLRETRQFRSTVSFERCSVDVASVSLVRHDPPVRHGYDRPRLPPSDMRQYLGEFVSASLSFLLIQYSSMALEPIVDW